MSSFFTDDRASIRGWAPESDVAEKETPGNAEFSAKKYDFSSMNPDHFHPEIVGCSLGGATRPGRNAFRDELGRASPVSSLALMPFTVARDD